MSTHETDAVLAECKDRLAHLRQAVDAIVKSTQGTARLARLIRDKSEHKAPRGEVACLALSAVGTTDTQLRDLRAAQTAVDETVDALTRARKATMKVVPLWTAGVVDIIEELEQKQLGSQCPGAKREPYAMMELCFQSILTDYTAEYELLTHIRSAVGVRYPLLQWVTQLAFLTRRMCTARFHMHHHIHHMMHATDPDHCPGL